MMLKTVMVLRPCLLFYLVAVAVLIYPDRLEAWIPVSVPLAPLSIPVGSTPWTHPYSSTNRSPRKSMSSSDRDDSSEESAASSSSSSSSSTDTGTAPPLLPSTYDTTLLPAGIRGEAVRQAVRSERGICIDFTSDLYPQINVGVVKVAGKGTLNFLNSKLTNSFAVPAVASTSTIAGGGGEGEEGTVRMEKGVVTEACLLESSGRMIDRILVVTFANDGVDIEASLITSPGHAGSALFQRLDPFIFPLDGVNLIDLFPTTTTTTTTATVTSTSNLSRSKLFTVAGKTIQEAQSAVRKHVLPSLMTEMGMDPAATESYPSFSFPQNREECLRYTSISALDNIHREVQVTVLEHAFLPGCLCHGYTFLITTTTTAQKTLLETNNEDDDDDDDEQNKGKDKNKDKDKNKNLPQTQTTTPTQPYSADLIYNALISDDTLDGPVELGPLEYETLRIEGGQPGFGHEITCDEKQRRRPGQKLQDTDGGIARTNVSPFELHLGYLVDKTKGCYVGQEGIASLLKNKMGVPRTLYSVTFRDDDNFYNDVDYDDDDDDDDDDDMGGDPLSNKTFRPKVGDELYVLGSNEKIRVGTLTSVAEPGGTSSPETVALALVRRDGPILKKMKGMNLEIGFDTGSEDDFSDDDNDSFGTNAATRSGIIQPPPIDPLDDLEVVVGGSFTQGVLRVVASRRLREGLNLFEVGAWASSDAQIETGTVMGFTDRFVDRGAAVDGASAVEGVDAGASESVAVDNTGAAALVVEDEIKISVDDDVIREEDLGSMEDLEEAVKAATQAAAEATRKAEKLAALQKRTEEAVAARKKKKEEIQAQKEKDAAALASAEGSADDPDRIEDERKRKAEKMEMLQKKMQAGLEARRRKKSGL